MMDLDHLARITQAHRLERLLLTALGQFPPALFEPVEHRKRRRLRRCRDRAGADQRSEGENVTRFGRDERHNHPSNDANRPEARRVGEECGSTCRVRLSALPYKNKKTEAIKIQ